MHPARGRSERGSGKQRVSALERLRAQPQTSRELRGTPARAGSGRVRSNGRGPSPKPLGS
eukprot:138401-Alexandrium_andersonii.AAC.1